MRKRWLHLAVAGILCLGLCSCGASAVVDDVVDQTANVVQSEDENVLAVKGGTNSNYPDITYEEAFDDFFGNPTWKYFKGTHNGSDDDGDGEPDYTEDNIDVVEFTGTCTYADVNVKALIQFTLDKDEGSFEATYLSFNDVPQTHYELLGLINKVFESYVESHNSTTSSTQQENDPETDHEEYDDAYDGSYDEYDSESYDGEYDYSALEYSGYYQGKGHYGISFSAYTSTEGNEIGVAEIRYYDERHNQPVYLCEDWNNCDWVGEDSEYEAVYEMYVDGGIEYLCFYREDGHIRLDYNTESKNLDTLSLIEKYES